MRLLVNIIVQLVLLNQVFAGGLRASFGGVPNVCANNMLTDESTIFETCMEVDSSNNVIDRSGANDFSYSQEFDNAAWTKRGTCTVTANQVRAPDGTLTGDLIEGVNASGNDIYHPGHDVATGVPYTPSVWIKRITTIGVMTVSNPNGVASGRMFVDFAVLPDDWIRIYPGSPYVTLDAPFVGDPGASDGIHFYKFAGGPFSFYLSGAQFQENDGWRIGPGIYHPTGAVTKPRLDLTNTDNPTHVKSDFQGLDGNRLEGREFDGVTHEYSVAHHNSMNINDQDHTYTFKIMRSSAATGDDYILQHGSWGAAGILFFAEAANWRATYHSTGSTANVLNAMTTTDGRFHIVQLVRSSNIATLYVDGTAGTPVDVTGEGIDGAYSLFLGGTSAQWEGVISYVRINNRALSTDELAYDRNVLMGLGTGTGFSNPSWDFTRATTAYTTFADGTMAEVAANMPRVGGKGGGVLIEGQNTNVHSRSHELDTLFNTKTRCSMIADTAIALNGKTETDTLHEDGTAADNHHIRLFGTATSGIVYTFSMFVKPINRTWIRLRKSGTLDARIDFDIANGIVGTIVNAEYGSITPYADGWYRISLTWDETTTEVIGFFVYILEADNDDNFDGLDQDSYYLHGSQFEVSPFPTSYIETNGSQITRNADDLSIDPHEAGTNKIIIPEEFNSTTSANKLTIYYEAKCAWSGSANAGVNRFLFEISGNSGTASTTRNRIQFYVTDTGWAAFRLRDDSDVDHLVYTGADPVDFSEWHSIRAFIDFSDLSRMNLWVNDSDAGMTYVANTGTTIFDTTDTTIRFNELGAVNSFCKMTKPQIFLGEVTP